jgi:hypothetical protein
MSYGRRLAALTAIVATVGAAPAAAEPAGPRPGGGIPGGPPAAWIETAGGAWWLQPGSVCWRFAGGPGVCADTAGYSDRPRVRVRVGEIVRLHLGRDPDALLVTTGLRREQCARGLEPTPAAGGRRPPVGVRGVVSWRIRPRDHGYLVAIARYPEGDPSSLGRLEVVPSAAGGPAPACRPDHTPPRLLGIEIERTPAGVSAVVSAEEPVAVTGTLRRLVGGRALAARAVAARRGAVSSQQVLRLGPLASGTYTLVVRLRDGAGNLGLASRRIVVPAGDAAAPAG